MEDEKQTYVSERLVLITSIPPATEVVTQNQRRIALLMMSGSASTFFSTVPANLTSPGGGANATLIASPNNALVLSKKEHGALVNSAWYAGISVGTDTVQVIEVLES